MNKESIFATYIEKSSYFSHRKVFLRSRGRRAGKQGGKKSKESLCVSVRKEPRHHRQHRRAAGGGVGRCWNTARWVCPLSQIKTLRDSVNQTTCQENTQRIKSSTSLTKTGGWGGDSGSSSLEYTREVSLCACQAEPFTLQNRT